MLHKTQLSELLADPKLKITDRALLILAFDVTKQKTVTRIKELALEFGNPELRAANLSSFLDAAKPRVTRLSDGWILTANGRSYLENKFSLQTQGPGHTVALKLRAYLSGINDSDTKSFLAEAVACFEHHLYRSAVVLTWVGAISLLQDFIIKNKLNEFNIEAKKRDIKWKDATVKDQLSRMQEYDFLEVLNTIGVLGKNVKQQLQNQNLNLRNGCGHPNSLKIGEHVVAAHIEFIILNIFTKF